MAVLDLRTYDSIYSALFVKIDVPGFEVLRFSNHYKPYTLTESDGTSNEYTNLGSLLSITDGISNIRANPEQMTITIAGVPYSAIAVATDQKLKGSKIEMRRLFMNGATFQAISTPVLKFQGFVDNYFVSEEYPEELGADSSTCSIGMVCSTLFDLYKNKTAGRRTNDYDQKRLYPGDLSMDRVAVVAGANFNFGARR